MHEHRSLSAYGGRGRSNGYLGTGAVVVEDPVAAAKQWASSLGPGVVVTRKMRSAWEDYASKLQLLPANVQKGWEYLMGKEEMRAVARRVFLEATSWWGRSAPHIFQAKGQASGDGFEFSKEGTTVWKAAQALLPKDKSVRAMDVVKSAAKSAGVSLEKLPPSDVRLLELAVTWLQTGKAKDATPAGIKPRIGGAPGGPFRSTGIRGAP